MSTTEVTEAIAKQVPIKAAEQALGKVDHVETESSPSLQRKVTDLESQLAELEKVVKALVGDKQTKTEHENKEDDSGKSGDDKKKPNNDKKKKEEDDDDKKKPKDNDGHKDDEKDDEKDERDDKKNDKFNCEPAWRLRYVRPKINWRTELVTDDSTGEEAAIKRRSAIVVYYEYPEGSMSQPDEPPSGVLPLRIRINSYRLDRLLADATGLASPPFPTRKFMTEVFVSHHDKLKETLGDLEKSFAIESKIMVDGITSEMLGAAPWPPESRDDSDGDTKALENKKRDIVLLRCFIDMSEKFLGSLIRLQSNITERTMEKISFANLWFLYQPGDVIFGQEPTGSKKYNAYKIFCVTGGRPCLRCQSHAQTSDHKQHGPSYNDLKLHCYSWSYDGSRLMPLEATKSISLFDGEKSIQDLPYFPKKLCKSNDPVVTELVARGNTFQRCLYGHGTYNGTTLGKDPRHINEDVFVDFKTGHEFNRNREWIDDSNEVLYLPDRDDKSTWEPRCSVDDCESKICNSCNISDETLNFHRAAKFVGKKEYILELVNNDMSGLDENQLAMLPAALLGYGLRSKEWFRLDPVMFEFVSISAKQRQQAFTDLVLPPETKNLLKAMVKTHTSRSQDSKSETADAANEIDLVKGKGKGLIIFLYGPPGVGKTSTAETIAACTTPARPLYPITCGDLGSDPVEIQKNLDHHFTLAHRWNCVLLLDEADVYLAERDIRDLSRNGIVSVFLRNLEYYSGVLFLTSNREGLIDEAFKSRIRVALRYKAIDLKGTVQIWRNIMRKIGEENMEKKLPVTFDKEDLEAWALEHFEENRSRRADGLSPTSTATWNGRQIRNAFQTAIALATFERLELLERRGLTEEQALAKKKPKYSEIQLTYKHFEKVAKVVGEFEDYLVGCRGDEGERAEMELRRKDSHDPTARHEAVPRTPKTKGTPKSALRSRRRVDHGDDETMSSPAPSRKAKKREPEVKEQEEEDEEGEEEEEEEEKQIEKPGRNRGREQPKSWRSRKAKDKEDETSSDSD
ncbi:hypothetical protein CSHISOI_03558 [Colletotrichum shisoi]|uniref:AAA+ ATPase domain-containing protein n=1 Tax=Colletotrichum shisoi TaxID=2078593 RepID=A0A5Q4BY37_9PEZI|nr:hypothetical protein CSHISOI_03558 [Colletotrichum shisoi]